MLKFVKGIFKKEDNKPLGFFDLPADKQRKIIKKAAREANEDQQELMKKYKEQLKFRDCSN